MFLLLAGAILLVMVYYYAYPMWAALGLRSSLTDSLMLDIYQAGTLRSPWSVRFVCIFFTTVSVIVRSGSSKASTWLEVLLPLISGLVLFLGSAFLGSGIWFVITCVTGYILFLIGAILLGRLVRSFDAHLPDYWDTFEQCEELIENEDSVNIPMTYQYEGKLRNGYINVVSPQRGCMVIGIPGSGKTYSIYGPFFRQMMQKGYAMFVYDYKYPDLTHRVMNELLDNYGC